MTRSRAPVILALPLLLAAAHGAAANEPSPAAIAADPMYMAVYGPENRVASIDVQRALPAELPVAKGPGAYDQEDFALNDTRRRNPFRQHGARE